MTWKDKLFLLFVFAPAYYIHIWWKPVAVALVVVVVAIGVGIGAILMVGITVDKITDYAPTTRHAPAQGSPR